MKKLTLLLLLMVSTSVFSEWKWVGASQDSTNYIDFGTIKKKGNKAKMWRLYDFKTVQKYSGLSQIIHYEYDCEEETSRMLDFYSYSGNMAQGDIISSMTSIENKPESIIPGSVSENSLNIACDKK